MPILKAKILKAATAAALSTALAEFQAGAGTPAVSDQRGMSVCAYKPRSDHKSSLVMVLVHEGLDMPASKTADQQFISVEADSVDEVQDLIDEALANAVHLTKTDGVTTTPGTLTSAGSAFAAADVGRLIEIGGVKKAITVRNSGTSVDYDDSEGDFDSGTGITFSLLGAESLQAVNVSAFEEDDGDTRIVATLAVEGQVA